MTNTMTSKNISSHVNLSHWSLCQGDTEYYCLTCEQNLCPACKTKHSINLDTNEHNITLYKYRSRLPSTREPCNNHPNQDYEMYCNICALPFCVDCTEHKEHSVRDLITVYKEQRKKFNRKSTDTLYFLQVPLVMIKSDFIVCKNKMSTILSEMSRELQKVKDHLDTVSIEAYIKRSLHKISQNQTAAMNKHLSKIKLFDASQHKFVHKPTQFFRFINKTPSFHINVTTPRVQHLPLEISTTEMDLQCLIKLLNKIQYIERGKRKIRNEELLGLISVPELQKSSTLENFSSCEHISSLTRDRVWISEQKKLVLIDIPTGNIIHTLTDVVSGSWRGLHTVNNDRDLFYISNNNSILKLTNDRKTATTFINMKDLSFEPRSVYCTPSTGDLLIGVRTFYSDENGKVGKVARFDKTGKLTMTIPKRYKRPPLFKDPNYITENNNGDIVVSDYWCGVVVTDRVGKHLFSYKDTPFGLRLLPRGICTDALSHILVCDFNSGTVLILDKEGNFLLYIPTQISLGHFAKPCSLNYDWNNHLLWIGSWNNTVSRYRHINRHFVLTDNRESCADYDSEVLRYFKNPMHLQELESIMSLFRRGYDNFFELLEDPASLAMSLIEGKVEISKAGHSLALKYDIPMPKAYTELIKVLLSRIIPEKDTNDADVMMKTDDKNEKEEISKTISLLLESCVLNVAERYKNIDLERIITMQIRPNDVSMIIKEIITKIMEKYKMPNNENARVQDFVKDIFENATIQDFIKKIYQIESMQDVPDFVKDIFENASMQDCFENILQNASSQDFFQNLFQNASMLNVVKDIFVITMDVLSIFNQRKETLEVQQIAE